MTEDLVYEKTKCKNYAAICSKCVSIYEVIVGRWNKPKRRRLFKKHRLTCVYVIESTLARVTQYIRCPCMGSLHLERAYYRTQFLWLFRHCFRPHVKYIFFFFLFPRCNLSAIEWTSIFFFQHESAPTPNHPTTHRSSIFDFNILLS